MKVLLDECVDWRLLRDLTAHEARTVRQLGWEHVKNGALLKLAATEFDIFVTVDGNLPYQQNADLRDRRHCSSRTNDTVTRPPRPLSQTPHHPGNDPA